MLPPKGRYPCPESIAWKPEIRKTTMTPEENPDELEKELFVEGDDDLLEDEESDEDEDEEDDEDEEVE